MLYGTLYGVACVLIALPTSPRCSPAASSAALRTRSSSHLSRVGPSRRWTVCDSTADISSRSSPRPPSSTPSPPSPPAWSGTFAVEYFQPASTQALDVAGRGVVGSNPTDDFATHGHGHRRHALFAFASDAERPAGTLLAPTNKYVPAFDIGAAALLLCALGARSWWAERRPDEHADTRDADARAVESAMEGIVARRRRRRGETRSDQRRNEGLRAPREWWWRTRSSSDSGW